MDYSSAVRDRLIDICADLELSWRQLSLQCNIPYSTLCHYLSGTNADIKVSTLFQICEGLDISIIEFFSSEQFENTRKS